VHAAGVHSGKARWPASQRCPEAGAKQVPSRCQAGAEQVPRQRAADTRRCQVAEEMRGPSSGRAQARRGEDSPLTRPADLTGRLRLSSGDQSSTSVFERLAAADQSIDRPRESLQLSLVSASLNPFVLGLFGGVPGSGRGVYGGVRSASQLKVTR
jgi:hypothetical protein